MATQIRVKDVGLATSESGKLSWLKPQLTAFEVGTFFDPSSGVTRAQWAAGQALKRRAAEMRKK